MFFARFAVSKKVQRGFFIGIVLLISFLVLALSVAMHHQLGSVAKGVKSNENSLRLEWVARSALEDAVAKLRANNGLDGPQARIEIPDIPGAAYESDIFNNLMGQKDSLNPEAPGALSPDQRAWIANGSAYISVTAYLGDTEDGQGAVAAASATAGYGNHDFDAGILANNSLAIPATYLGFYDGVSGKGTGSLMPVISQAGSNEVASRELGITRTNNLLTVDPLNTVGREGLLRVYEERLSQVEYRQPSANAASAAFSAPARGRSIREQVVSTRARDFIPRTVTPTGLGDATMHIAGDDFDIRTLYPSEVGGFELHEGSLRLSGGVYVVEGDIVLKDVLLETFGNPDEPTTLIVNGNIAFDGVQANCYGSYSKPTSISGYGAETIAEPGEPMALKILVMNNHRVAIRDSNIAGLIATAEGSVMAENSNIFGFIAADDVSLNRSLFFSPMADIGKNISLFGEIELYEIQEDLVAGGGARSSPGNLGDHSGQDILAENHGFAPEAPMPEVGQQPLTGPVSGVGQNPAMPPSPGGDQWNFPAEQEVVVAPADAVVPPGDDVVSGVPVTVYDPPAGAVPSCFPADVVVQTPGGTQPIGTLKVGDAVVTYSDQGPISFLKQSDSFSGIGQARKISVIEQVFVHPDSHIGVVELERVTDGVRTELEVTSEHVVYSALFHEWYPIGALPVNSVMLSPKGPLKIVRAWAYRRSGITYNFELAAHHTYCVGELGAWVHNYKEPVIPPPPPPPTVATTGGGTGGATAGPTGGATAPNGSGTGGGSGEPGPAGGAPNGGDGGSAPTNTGGGGATAGGGGTPAPASAGQAGTTQATGGGSGGGSDPEAGYASSGGGGGSSSSGGGGGGSSTVK